MSLVQRLQTADRWAHGAVKKGLEEGKKFATDLQEETAREIARAKANIQNGDSFVSAETYAKLEKKATEAKETVIKVGKTIKDNMME